MKRSILKQSFACLLAFIMVIGLLPMNVTAGGTLPDNINVKVAVYDYTASSIGAENASADGIVLAETTVSLSTGATALDAIVAATTAAGLVYSITESEYGDYVDSINGLSAEMDGYPESGWVFSLNDNFSNSGAAATVLSENDVVEFHYSLAGWGTDVGSYWSGGPTITSFNLSGVAGAIAVAGHDGTQANPYGICVNLPAGTALTALAAALETTLHPEYRNLSVDLTGAQDYTSPITFKLYTDGGFYETWYKVYVTSPEVKTGITFTLTPTDATLKVYDSGGKEVTPVAGSMDYSGLTNGDEYTYNVSRFGYVSERGSFTAGLDTVKNVLLTAASSPETALPDFTGEWTNFRGNEQNMGITTAETPGLANEAILKWGWKHSSGWAESITPPIIVNDALYIAKGKTVAKIDKTTGEIISTSEEMAGAVGYALNPITYGGGMLFVPVGSGRIQALRADTLELLWVSEALGGQTLTPITYKNGYIYTGTWNRETATGTYFCLSITDEDPTTSGEIKYCTWKIDHTGGFYWAGAYATENFVIFGSDDGSGEGTHTETGMLYSVNPISGMIIDTIAGVKGDIRSTVSYDAVSDRIYFTTKGGEFYQVKVNTDGTFDDSATRIMTLGGMSTGTPLVYNGRAYVGVAGASQFGTSGHRYRVVDVSDMSEIYSVDVPGYVQTSALLSTAYVNTTGKVYVYITYNALPGGIFVLEDSVGQTEGNGYSLFTPGPGMSNYCICSLVCDADGTIYYKNDSGYLMAVTRNMAWLNGITVEGGNAAMPAFDSGTLGYEVTVDRGTDSVTVIPAVNTGSAVTVNGTADSAAVTLTDGVAAAAIVVTNGSYTRTYTLNIRERSNDATLGVLYGSSSNSPNSSKFTMTPSFYPETLHYTVSGVTGTFVRLWLKANDAYATVMVKAVSGVKDKTAGDVINVTSVDAATGQKRYALYYSTDPASDTVIADITVTAEDGVAVNTYRVTLTKKNYETFAAIKTITAFSVNNHQGIIDESNHTIAVTVPYGSSVTALTPSITVNPGAVVSPASGIAQDFTRAVTYTVTAMDNSAQTYTVTVTAGSNPNTGGNVPVTGNDQITTTLTNGVTQRGSRLTFDVWARDKSGSKIASTVTLNGTHVPYTWDDVEKTSYTLTFTQEGGNTVVVCAGDATETYSISYVPTQNGGVVGQAVVSIEAFSIGGGYVVEPLSVDIYEGENAAQLLDRVLSTHGLSKDQTGTLTSGFYLAGIKGAALASMPKDGSSVPADLLSRLGSVGTRSNHDWLGEFDFTNGSGWMYCVNNVFPNVGFSDYYLNEGDVMRIQYTLALGADIGGAGATGGGSNFYAVADKDRLITLLAQYGCDSVPSSVLDIAAKLNATDSEVSQAIAMLTSGGTTTDTVTPVAGGTKGEMVVTIAPKLSVSNGEAEVTVTSAEIRKAIDLTKKSGTAEIVIAPKITSPVEKVKFSIPRTSFEEIAADTGMVLTVKSDIAGISIPNSLLAAIASKSGSTVSITVEKLDNSALSIENRALVGDHPVYDFSIRVEDKEITDFGNTVVTVSMPYTPKKGENTDMLKIYYIDDHGKAVNMTGAYYNEATGSIIFKSNHFSAFAIVYEESKVAFTDIKAEDWFYDAVEYVTKNGLFKGTSESKFSPNANMTRAMLVTVLYRLAEQPAVSSADTYTDVSPETWYSDAVAWADHKGIVSGYGNGKFGTDDSITREAMVAMLYRYASVKGFDVKASAQTDSFKDNGAISGWAEKAVKWAVGTGLVSGTGNDMLDPAGTATRAQVAVLLQRFAEKIAK